MDRNDKKAFIRDRIAPGSVGLEIGPHVSPMFRKSQGDRVKYVESRTTEQLRELMVQDGRDPDLVEEIDFVLMRERSLSENVNGETFDWVTSSHVLEHIPDFVSHMNDVQSVLKDGGVYAAIVPDRNLCFDCLKPPSSLGEVLQAHLEKRTMPTVASNIDELRYGARPRGVKMGGWTLPQADAELVQKYPGWEGRVRAILAAQTEAERPDRLVGHSWRFDPISFAQIAADLCRLEVIGLQLTELYPTYNMDFIAFLTKVPVVAPDAVARVARLVAAGYRPPHYPPKLP